MGNRHSHDESDGEDRGHSGTFRDFLKTKSPTVSASGKKNNKEDIGDGPHHQVSNNSSISSDKDPGDKSTIDSITSESGMSSSSKPDGITKLAKVLIKRSIYKISIAVITVSYYVVFLITGTYNSISTERDKGWNIPKHFFSTCFIIQYA